MIHERPPDYSSGPVMRGFSRTSASMRLVGIAILLTMTVAWLVAITFWSFDRAGANSSRARLVIAWVGAAVAILLLARMLKATLRELLQLRLQKAGASTQSDTK